MMRFLKIALILLAFPILGSFVPQKLPGQKLPPFLNGVNDAWVDSVFNSLTPDERLGQLFMVAAYSNRDSNHLKELDSLVCNYGIGGLIFFQGGPVRQAQMTNLLQSYSKVPLYIAMDCEWGLAMRLDSTPKFPRQMTFGAANNDTLVYEMGVEIARQFKRLGMHINFAPSVDVNNNPLNPVIGSRSFGEHKVRVAEMGIQYMNGMQDNGILGCAKHFPGHGDTDSDSHKTLPIINHPTTRMDTLELYPFREMIRNGVGSMMVAHLYIPAYDTTTNQASTLSTKVVKDLLQDTLGFQGLIFTDALNMQGVAKFYEPGDVSLRALLAGNDVLLFAENVPVAIEKIKQAIVEGKITQEEIDRRCKKVLRAKAWSGLNNYKPIAMKNLYEDLNTVKSEVIIRKTFSSAITVVTNKNSVLPLKNLDKLNIACVSIGDTSQNVFFSRANDYAAVTCFNIRSDADTNKYKQLYGLLQGFNTVIINIQNTNSQPAKNYGVTPQTVNFIKRISDGRKVILNVFGNPYTLNRIEGAEFADGLIVAYEENNFTLDYAAQLIFGGMAAKGKLPVNVSTTYRMNSGKATTPVRLGYTIPEMFGINSAGFSKVDSIALDGIAQHAYPGCQVLVAQKGSVIYRKNFGAHTYEANAIPVSNKSIYDVASVTKIAATLPVIMQLTDKGQVNIDGKLSAYLPELGSTNKKDIVLRDMLAHQSGLKAWIPFYQSTLKEGKPDDFIYSAVQSETFPYRVAENLYIRKSYTELMYNAINESEPGKKEYVYSDLGYYYLKKIAENMTAQPLDVYVKNNFYEKLGMTTTTYHPRDYFPLERMAPTEYDMVFRKQLIQGDVHDPGAAMLGGVGGHAGLFSNANDLAKLMQLYMQMGEYGGERYLSETVLKEFTRCQFCETGNRRGLGFDKPELNGKPGPTFNGISMNSFGHSGFTGTYAWADPDKEIVYIFLSNRVYPDAENKKLIDMNIRTKIQEAVHGVLGSP